MFCLIGTVQRILNFRGTLFDFLTVPDVLAESCNLGSNFRFLFSKKNLLFWESTADFILELGTLSSQRFQL